VFLAPFFAMREELGGEYFQGRDHSPVLGKGLPMHLGRRYSDLYDDFGKMRKSRDFYLLRYLFIRAEVMRIHGEVPKYNGMSLAELLRANPTEEDLVGGEPLETFEDDDVDEEEEVCDAEGPSRQEESDQKVLQIQSEIVANMPRLRWKFSNDYLLWSYHIYNETKGAGYEALRERRMLPLPAPSTLRKHFSDDVRLIEEDLEKTSCSAKVAVAYRDMMDPRVADRCWPVAFGSKLTVCCLSVDAFAVLWSHVKKDKPESDAHHYMFVYEACFLNRNIPMGAVHLMKSKSGNANAEVLVRAEEIRENLRSINVDAKFIAVDGDHRYDQTFKEQNEKIRAMAREMNDGEEKFLPLDDICKRIDESGKWLMISDFLHIDKNGTAKLKNSMIVWNPRCPQNAFNASLINEILDMPECLLTKSSIVSMWDVIPIKVNTMENAMKLLQDERSTPQMFGRVAVYAAWTTVLTNENLSFQQRLWMQDFVIHVFCLLQREMEKGNWHERVGENKRAGKDFVTFASQRKIERMIDSGIGSRIALVTQEDLRQDAMGTHCTENLIGYARSLGSDQRALTILWAVARQIFTRRHISGLGMYKGRSKRVNLGGCISTPNGDRTDVPPLDPADAALAFAKYIGAMDDGVSKDTPAFQELASFFAAIAADGPGMKIPGMPLGPTGSPIMSRNIGSPLQEEKAKTNKKRGASDWTDDEMYVIDEGIMLGMKVSEIRHGLIGIPSEVTDAQVRHRVKTRQDEMRHGIPLTDAERAFIQGNMAEPLPCEEFRHLFDWRTDEFLSAHVPMFMDEEGYAGTVERGRQLLHELFGYVGGEREASEGNLMNAEDLESP
jgi:hypothetical protein